MGNITAMYHKFGVNFFPFIWGIKINVLCSQIFDVRNNVVTSTNSMTTILIFKITYKNDRKCPRQRILAVKRLGTTIFFCRITCFSTTVSTIIAACCVVVACILVAPAITNPTWDRRVASRLEIIEIAGRRIMGGFTSSR